MITLFNSILSFIFGIINSVITTILKKIIVGFIIFVLLHSVVIMIGEGGDASYGEVLANTVKMDFNFIMRNIGEIFSTIWENIKDFFKAF